MNPTRSLATPASQARNDTMRAQNGNAHTFARNIAHNAATNALAGTAGGIANVALDDSDDALAKKFAKGFALAVAGKVAAKHGMPAGARASKAAFDFAMQKSAQFSTLLRENPQLFTRLLNKQLTDDFAQFGGQSSELNAERYAVAKELAQKGASEEEILARTGWFRGLDGNWKFQLDLAKGAAYKLKEGSYHLNQLFKQESLYAAYPFLRNVRVEIARLPENVNGSFEPTTRIITLNSANNKLDFTKALCHELQHIIQKYEGFAQGSSPKNPNYWTNAGEVEARATFKGGESNPRQRLASERKEGEIIEAMSRASDSEIPNSSTLAHSQKLESAYLKDTRRIDTEALDRHAMPLPKVLDEQQFMAQAKTDSQGIARVETPIGDVKIHMKNAWEHINKNNTNQQDRTLFSGAFLDTISDPLAIIRQKYYPTKPANGESIVAQDSYVFFKPYKDSSGSKYLAAFFVDKNGELLHKTFFDPSLSKINKWIQSHDDDLLYYKYDNQQDKVYSIAGQRAQTDKDAQRIKLEKRELERHIAEYENKIKTLERKINSAGDVARKNRDKNISEQERYRDLLFQTKKKYYHIPDQEASKMDFYKSLSERQKADFLNDLERLTHKSDVDLDGIQDVISRDDFWKGKYRDFADESQHHIEMAQRNMILLKELTRLPLESQRELAEKWNATQMRANIEKTFNTQPLKEFGTNYAEYMRDGEGAIHKLRSEKQGQVSGAFYREDLEKLSGNGNIDLVWGDSRFGLAHILDKHPNMTNDILGDVLQNGELKIRQNEAIQIRKDNYKVILKSNWKGEPTKNKWIVTAYEDEKGLSISSKPLTEADSLASNSKGIIPQNNDNPQYSLKSPLESLKSAQGRLDGLRAFAKYLANPPAHLRGDVQRLRADSAAMRELDMHTRKAMTDKANAIDSLAYQNGYPEPQYSMKNPRQKQKFAEDSVGILQQIRTKSREGMEKILNNSWVNSALGTRIYGRNFDDYRHIKDVFDKDIAENASNALLLHNKLKLLSEDAQRKMHHYMNGDTNGEDLSSELKALADSFRKEVRKETDELVKLGLLDKKTAEKWGDVYLLREYSTRIVDRVKRGLRGLKSEDYGIGLDSIHMRGKTQKVSEKKYQEMLQKGEIGDVTKGKWEVLQEPSKHEPKYVLRRDYTRSEREKKGEIDLISYSLPRTLAKIQNQKRIATLFDAISKDGDVARKLEKGAEIPSGFRRLNGEQYGALRGFVVRNEIADDIECTTNRVLGESKEILKQIAGLATYWKKFKTVHNPTSHINNMIGNVFFLGMEGNLKGIVDNEIASVR
ncbi:MAG: hypothetical protein K2N69_09400 [Helicobacter sp.]|nr:hypothetical protein [Helicobacter sp.]